MTSPLLSLMLEYAASAAAGVVIGLLFKLYFAWQVKRRMFEYQGEIVRSHAKILRLEEANSHLERRVNELERSFSKDRIYMN